MPEPSAAEQRRRVVDWMRDCPHTWGPVERGYLVAFRGCTCCPKLEVVSGQAGIAAAVESRDRSALLP